MERSFYGASLLRTAGRVFVLATLAGTVACGGCGEDPPTTPNNTTNTNNQTTTNNVTSPTNNTIAPLPGSITVSPTMLTFSENGGTGTFSITLDEEPESDVVINLASMDESEATVSPAQLTFSAAGAAQTVTVTGVDDSDLDGTQMVTITTTVVGTGNYAGVDAADVIANVTDDDMAGGDVSPTGITVFEGGAGATFTVVLSAMPSGPVTIPISVSDDTEITADVTELTFTAANFAMAQTVTIDAIDDTEVEPGQTLSVIVGAATGGGYDGVDLTDVSVTVVDNDVPTVAVMPQVLTTNETGTTATFTVSLNPPPTADVVITATSGDATEGSVDGPQTIAAGATSATFTVTGLDDTIVDGTQTYQITLAATSADAAYDGISIPAVSVANNDNDSVGVNVMPTLLSVSEQGATSANFTIALTTDPGETVTIDLSLTDATQASLSTTLLTFDSANFATPQTVTVTAIDDTEDDGNVAVQVITTMNATLAYLNAPVADVTVNVIDNDAAGITVAPTTGLITTEAGGTATFTVVLNSQPTANVTIGLTSSDTTEGTVSPASLTFTTGTWNTAQTVTITGVDDAQDDGNVLYNIVTAAAVSTDASYSGLNAVDVSVTNTDDDTAGFIVTPTTGLRTSESGGQATFTVALLTPPTANVTIPMQSTNTSEGTVSPQSLTFTPADFSTPQTVTITGVDDALRDGPVAYIIILDTTTSTDASYNNLDPPNVFVTNDDNEAGFTVTPTTLALNETGSGSTASFTVRLNSPPTQNVVVTITGDGNQGDEYNFTPTQFVFTPANFLTARTVNVTGVADAMLDGPQTWQISVAIGTTLDVNYAANCGGGCPAVNVNGTTADSDSIGVTVTPSNVTISEAECQLVTISLSTDATSNLTYTVTLAAGSQLQLQNVQTSIAQNASSATFEVCGIDDNISENTVQEVVTISAFTAANMADPYHNLNPADVNVTLTDNDTPAIEVFTFYEFAANGDAPLLVTFEDDVDPPNNVTLGSFIIRLSSPPTGSVTVTLTSSNPSEAKITTGVNGPPPAPSQNSITAVFQTNNWNQFQQFEMVGQDDALPDGTQTFDVAFTTASADPFYNNLVSPPLRGHNLDDDVPGWTVLPVTNGGNTTSENGQCAENLVVINTPPTSNVTITLGVTPPNTPTPDEIVLNTPSMLTFPQGNGPFAHFVEVCGVADATVDGDQVWTVFPATQVTTDVFYSNAPFPTLSGINRDIDAAGLNINFNNNADEDDANQNITVSLLTQPTANVTVTIASSDTTEATIATGASLTFTTANWNNPQIATYDPQEDNTIDGDQNIFLNFATTSTDTNYNALARSEPLQINDIDQGNFIFTPTNATTVTTTEGGGTFTIQVRLSAIPTGNVVVPVYSFNTAEATVSPAALTFTAANWNVNQTVTVTGVDDLITDGDQNFQIWFDVPTSTDPAYDGHPAFPVLFNGLNADNEVPGVSIVQPSAPNFLVVNENGLADTFQVRLNTAPAPGNNVRILFGATSGSATNCPAGARCARAWPTNGAVAAQPVVTTSVTFTNANWNVLQTVTVTGENNTRTLPVEWFYVNSTIDNTVMNADPTYTNAIFIEDVLVASIDNDEEAIVALSTPLAQVGGTFNSNSQVNQAVITGENGTSSTFYLLGTDLPTANVTVNFTYNGGEATGPASFTLTQSNYSTLNPIVVTGANDGPGVDALGYTPFTISMAVSSTDLNYNALTPTPLQGYNLDNDQCALVLLPPTTPTDVTTRMAGGGTPTVVAPFVVATTANLTGNVPVQTFLAYSGAVNNQSRNVTFTSGAQAISLQAYATGPNNANFQLDLSVIASDACYQNAADKSLYGISR